MAHHKYSSTSSLPLGEQFNNEIWNFFLFCFSETSFKQWSGFAEQEWGSTALALHQALSALAPPQALPGTPRPTAHLAQLSQAPAIASTCEPPKAQGASHQVNSSDLLHSQQTGVSGTGAAVSPELQGAMCTDVDVTGSQAAVAQGYHFATDLLGTVPTSMSMCACSALTRAC